KAKVTVTTAARLTGRIEIRSGSKVVAKGAIKSAAGAGTKSTSITLTTKKLKKGTRKLTIRYLGSPTIKASSKSYRVRVR
ncbi:MAG: Ig-like domain repeat protein, partial [Actinobacteria bacterium]|nr:Ig-like domain repeat protein [Actinomycetota bacterium]